MFTGDLTYLTSPLGDVAAKGVTDLTYLTPELGIMVGVGLPPCLED